MRHAGLYPHEVFLVGLFLATIVVAYFWDDQP